MHSIVISYYLDFKLLHGSLVPFILAIFSSPLDSTYTPLTTFNALRLYRLSINQSTKMIGLLLGVEFLFLNVMVSKLKVIPVRSHRSFLATLLFRQPLLRSAFHRLYRALYTLVI